MLQWGCLMLPKNFYPRPPRGGRRQYHDGRAAGIRISIHALREEGDAVAAPAGRLYYYFYPRPPRGGRLRAGGAAAAGEKFLSTPSARRATIKQDGSWSSHSISIHALREEGDTAYQRQESSHPNFYPRPPRGGRLHPVFCPCFLVAISIHALREEGDRRHGGHSRNSSNFYPRPPRGGRLRTSCTVISH